MKKMFEFAVKSNVDLPFDSKEFSEIKEQIEESIKEHIGPDNYKKFGYQCNCTKVKDTKTNEYVIIVKVYSWPKEIVQETNFFLNTDSTTTFQNNRTEDEDNEIINHAKQEISSLTKKNISYNEKLNSIKTEIDELLGLELTTEVTDKLKMLTVKMKSLERKITKNNNQINYYKSEFLI